MDRASRRAPDCIAPQSELVLTYQKNGQRATAEWIIGSDTISTTTYNQDDLGRIDEILQAFTAGSASRWTGSAVPTDRAVAFEYKSDGLRKSISRYDDDAILAGNLIGKTTYSYNDDGRINLISHQDDAANDLAKFDFSAYDKDGRIRERTTTRTFTDVSGALPAYLKESFDYDQFGQLLRVNLSSGADALSADSSDQDAYRYDDAGNRTSADTSDASLDFTQGLENRLTSDSDYLYEYDDQGRLTKKSVKLANGTADAANFTAYTWDHRGLLLKVSTTTLGAVSQVVEYGYDTSGRRTARKATGAVTESAVTHYDGQNRLAEFDATGNIVRHYLSGPGPNEVLAVDQGGATAGAMHDQLGSVATWGTHNGTAWSLQHQSFDAFGNLNGQTTDLPVVGALPTIWAGHQLDAATGLYHMQARWYDPRSGQFLSPDPIRFAAGDSNLYRYVGNDPTNSIDPNGLMETRRDRWIRELDETPPVQTGYNLLDVPFAFLDSIGKSFEKTAIVFGTYWDADVQEQRVEGVVRRNEVIHSGGSIGTTNALIQLYASNTTDNIAFGGVGYDPIIDRPLEPGERVIRVAGGTSAYVGTFIPLAQGARAVPAGTWNPSLTLSRRAVSQNAGAYGGAIQITEGGAIRLNSRVYDFDSPVFSSTPRVIIRRSNGLASVSPNVEKVWINDLIFDQLPGRSGVTVPRRLSHAEMAALTEANNVEFSLIYRADTSTFELFSGTIDTVRVPFYQGNTRWISHTHPLGSRYASKADRLDVLLPLQKVQQQFGHPQQQSSTIVPVGSSPFRFNVNDSNLQGGQ